MFCFSSFCTHGLALAPEFCLVALFLFYAEEGDLFVTREYISFVVQP